MPPNSIQLYTICEIYMGVLKKYSVLHKSVTARPILCQGGPKWGTVGMPNRLIIGENSDKCLRKMVCDV